MVLAAIYSVRRRFRKLLPCSGQVWALLPTVQTARAIFGAGYHFGATMGTVSNTVPERLPTPSSEGATYTGRV